MPTPSLPGLGAAAIRAISRDAIDSV